jgi:adenine-specific DNA-methyltransferase
LMYPKAELSRVLEAKPELARKVWTWLSAISPDVVLGEGRVYGGGLHKVEPRELGNVPAEDIVKMLDIAVKKTSIQLEFFTPAKGSQNLELAR